MPRFLLHLLSIFAIFIAESANASVRDLGARQPSDAVLALPNDFLLAPDGSLYHPKLGLPLNGLRSSKLGLELNNQVIEGLETNTYMIIAAPAAYLVAPVGWVVIGAGTGGAEAWGSVGNYLATGESNYGAGDAALALIGMVPFGAASHTPSFAAAAAKAGAIGSKGLAGAREALNASRLAKAINCGPVARGLARNGWITARCFPGDTLASGKRMDQYRKDEMLTAWDDAKNAFVQARITQIFVHEHDGEFAEVTLTSGTSLKPTAEHPFRLAQPEQLGARPAVVFDAPQEGTYIAARYLRTGDLLLTPQGPIAVTSVRLVHDKIKVYNFEVEGLHNYTVGTDGVVVHNSCKTWNEFQRLTKGQYRSRAEASAAYKRLKNEQSPWPDGFTPSATELPAGTRFEMALSPSQPSTRPGAFGTFSSIHDVNFVRNNLAVKYAWKPEIDRVVTYELTRPTFVKSGPIGPQIDLNLNRVLPGGGDIQLQLLMAPSDRMNHLKIIGEKRIQ